jgi:hypothetical protein
MLVSGSKVLLSPTIEFAFSSTFSLPQDGSCATVVCAGLSGGEIATVQILDPISSTYINYLPSEGAVTFTANINTINFSYTHGVFRINKSATASAVGITVQQYMNKGY